MHPIAAKEGWDRRRDIGQQERGARARPSMAGISPAELESNRAQVEETPIWGGQFVRVCAPARNSRGGRSEFCATKDLRIGQRPCQWFILFFAALRLCDAFSGASNRMKICNDVAD